MIEAVERKCHAEEVFLELLGRRQRMAFDIGVDVPYNKFLSIESGFTYGPNDLGPTNTNIFPHTVAAGSVRVFPVHDYVGNLSAVAHAPVSFRHFRPYVLMVSSMTG